MSAPESTNGSEDFDLRSKALAGERSQPTSALNEVKDTSPSLEPEAGEENSCHGDSSSSVTGGRDSGLGSSTSFLSLGGRDSFSLLEERDTCSLLADCDSSLLEERDNNLLEHRESGSVIQDRGSVAGGESLQSEDAVGITEDGTSPEGRGQLLELGHTVLNKMAGHRKSELVTHSKDTKSSADGKGKMAAEGKKGEEGEEGDEMGEEGEGEPADMTLEERKEMYEAVKDGDIDLLEDLLEKPNADIRMLYFEENLLMAALRAGQLEMAEFLLDNGVDHTFATVFVNYTGRSVVGQTTPATTTTSSKSGARDNNKVQADIFQYTCRQMAYDRGYLDIVELIDILDKRLFPGVKPRPRVPRLRRPPPSPTISTFPELDDPERSNKDGELCLDTAAAVKAKQGTSQQRDSNIPAGSMWEAAGKFELDSPQTKSKKKLSKNLTDETAETEVIKGRVNLKQPQDNDRTLHPITPGQPGDRTLHPITPGQPGEKQNPEGLKSSKIKGDSSDPSVGTTLLTKAAKGRRQHQHADEDDNLKEDGYEGVANSPYLSSARHSLGQVALTVPKFQHLPIPVKTTQTSTLRRQTLSHHLQHCLPIMYRAAHPLEWMKVRTPGSYEVEKPLWHQNSGSLSSQALQLSVSSIRGLHSDVIVNLPSNSVPRNLPQAKGNVASGSAINTVPVGITQTNILKNSPSQNRTNDSSSKPSLSVTSPMGVTTRLVSAASKGCVTGDPSAKTLSSDRLHALKLKAPLPNYMSMTTSCFVKRRLEPNFTNTYAALDFVEPLLPSPAVPVLGDNQPRVKRKDPKAFDDVAISSSVRVFLSDISTVYDGTPSHLRSCRKRVTGSERSICSPRKQDFIPSKRNNSTLFHTPRLSVAGSSCHIR